MNLNLSLPIEIILSIVSLVVPSTSSTITLSSFIILLKSVDFPTFGCPRIEIFGIFSSISSSGDDKFF